MFKEKPKNYQICNNCVMDTSDPEISFDKNGNCDHCQNFYKNIKKDIDNYNENKSKQLQKLTLQI